MRRILLARPDLSASLLSIVMFLAGTLGILASFVAFLTGFVPERQTDPFVAASALLAAKLPWELRHRVRPARRLAFLFVILALGLMFHWWITGP